MTDRRGYWAHLLKTKNTVDPAIHDFVGDFRPTRRWFPQIVERESGDRLLPLVDWVEVDEYAPVEHPDISDLGEQVSKILKSEPFGTSRNLDAFRATAMLWALYGLSEMKTNYLDPESLMEALPQIIKDAVDAGFLAGRAMFREYERDAEVGHDYRKRAANMGPKRRSRAELRVQAEEALAKAQKQHPNRNRTYQIDVAAQSIGITRRAFYDRLNF